MFYVHISEELIRIAVILQQRLTCLSPDDGDKTFLLNACTRHKHFSVSPTQMSTSSVLTSMKISDLI